MNKINQFQNPENVYDDDDIPSIDLPQNKNQSESAESLLESTQSPLPEKDRSVGEEGQ